MDILGILKGFWESSGLAVLTWREGVMILVSFVLLYLAIAKKFEPLLLLPIAFGILLANLPGAGLTHLCLFFIPYLNVYAITNSTIRCTG